MFNLGSIINAVVAVIKGTRKISWSTLMTDLISYIPGVIRDLDRVIQAKKDGWTPDELKDIIDRAMAEFDIATGTDGLSLIPGMPLPQQELALDAFKQFLTLILYNRAKLEGYYVKDEGTV